MVKVRLKELSELNVGVAHPPDTNGQTIFDQLQRIGCQTYLIWPLDTPLPPKLDVIFAGVIFDSYEEMKAVLRKAPKPAPVVIGITDFENPAMLQLVLDLGAVAVTSKPVRSFGIMTNMVVARACMKRQNELQERIAKLEKKLAGQKLITKAKLILMDMYGMTEAHAFETIRKQAMSKRTSTKDMAQAIINAKELLSVKTKEI